MDDLFSFAKALNNKESSGPISRFVSTVTSPISAIWEGKARWRRLDILRAAVEVEKELRQLEKIVLQGEIEFIFEAMTKVGWTYKLLAEEIHRAKKEQGEDIPKLPGADEAKSFYRKTERIDKELYDEEKRLKKQEESRLAKLKKEEEKKDSELAKLEKELRNKKEKESKKSSRSASDNKEREKNRAKQKAQEEEMGAEMEAFFANKALESESALVPTPIKTAGLGRWVNKRLIGRHGEMAKFYRPILNKIAVALDISNRIENQAQNKLDLPALVWEAKEMGEVLDSLAQNISDAAKYYNLSIDDFENKNRIKGFNQFQNNWFDIKNTIRFFQIF